MRQVSQPVRDWLDKDRGVEPQLFVGVKWSDDAEVYYTSHDIPGALKSLVSIDAIDTTVEVQSTGGSQSAGVTLSDTSGELTRILETLDPHKRPAKVYLHFPGVPVDQAVPIIEGQINSPIEWDDSARTLRFTILSEVESRPFGFSAEEGRFRLLDPFSRTQPWPFRFGSTCHYPTVKIDAGVKGFLREGQGVVDPTLGTRICQVRQIQCPEVFVNVYSGDVFYTWREMREYKSNVEVPIELTVRYGRKFGGAPGGRFGGTSAETRLRFQQYFEAIDVRRGPEPECTAAKSSLLCELLTNQRDQRKYESKTLTIAGGSEFPQGRVITIRAGKVRYRGVMDGETFTIQATLRDDVRLEGECGPIPEFGFGYRLEKSGNPESADQCQRDPVFPTQTGQLYPQTVLLQTDSPLAGNFLTTSAVDQGKYTKQPVGGAGAGFRVVQDGVSIPFLWLPPGTDVYLEESSQLVHIASAVPGTVTQVAAYRTFGDNKILTKVPADRYQVFFTMYGDLQVIEIRMDRNLSDYAEEDWDDQLYVSFTSDVGPNPVDVIQWIAETFTDYTVDSTNFAAVKAKLNDYPCNASLTDRKDALQLVAQIAREARCAVRLSDGVISLVYLPEEPDSVRTLGRGDVVAGSFGYELTQTEDIATAHEVSYKTAGTSQVEADPDESRLSVQRNVDRYGFILREEDYVSINNEGQALKTATFWSIREANSYKRCSFQTTLQHLDLEVFDCITLDVGVFPETKAIIESIRYNADNSLLELTVLTPILSGTDEEYFWFWPAQKPAGVPYPESKYDVEDPRLDVYPPVGHPFYFGDVGPVVRGTLGDEFPSDLGDVPPTTICSLPTDAVVIRDIQPQFDRGRNTRDFSSLASRMDGIHGSQSGGNAVFGPKDGVDGPGEDNPRESGGCGSSPTGGCAYFVILTYVTPTLIATSEGVGGCLSAGPCTSKPADQIFPGSACSGPLDQECYTFANLAAARGFWQQKFNEAQQNKKNCNYNLNERKIYSAMAPAGGGGGVDSNGNICDGSNDPDIEDPLYKPGSGGLGST